MERTLFVFLLRKVTSSILNALGVSQVNSDGPILGNIKIGHGILQDGGNI